MAAIFNLFLVRTSGILRSSQIELPDFENKGITVGISLLSCIEAEIYVTYINFQLISFFQTWDIIWSSLIVLPNVENMGIAVGILLLSCKKLSNV